MKKDLSDTFNEKTLSAGMYLMLKRKPTLFNTAPIVWRRVKSVDFEKQKILCDDSIEYKFKQVLWNK